MSWHEVLMEGASDAQEQLNEYCDCGVQLKDHYKGSEWVPCDQLK